LSPYIGLGFDVIIMAALVATIIFAFRLSKQFDQMQADRKAFDLLISSLNVAASRAEAAVKALKDAAQQGGDQLQEKINAARTLSDELEIMVQAGDNMADRLQNAATRMRKATTPAEPQQLMTAEDAAEEMPADETPARAQPRSRAEKELLEALRAKQQS